MEPLDARRQAVQGGQAPLVRDGLVVEVIQKVGVLEHLSPEQRASALAAGLVVEALVRLS